MLCLRVYLKMSSEVHFWICPMSSRLHITPGCKTSGQQSLWRSLKWGSCEGARQTDGFLQHESCSGGVGVVSAGHSGSSASRPSRHGLGQRLPPELQLPVSPRRGPRGHQELLQRAGRLGPLVVIRVPGHTWGSGGAQWLLVGRHQPCWDGVVGLLWFIYLLATCLLLTLTIQLSWQPHLFRVYSEINKCVACIFRI